MRVLIKSTVERSNWNLGQAMLYGKVHVIRQRLGYAAPRKSKAVHKFMVPESREALCAKLELLAKKAR